MKKTKKKITRYKSALTRKLFRPTIPGLRILRNYSSEAGAKKKVAELRKRGYRSKWTETMGTYQVWVSARYFGEHPKARGYMD